MSGRFKYGKLYRVGAYYQLWKTDERPPKLWGGKTLEGNNTQVGDVRPETVVMVTKKGRWRYVQVLVGEMLGFIWCDPSNGLTEHFEEIQIEKELKREESGEEAPSLEARLNGINPGKGSSLARAYYARLTQLPGRKRPT